MFLSAAIAAKLAKYRKTLSGRKGYLYQKYKIFNLEVKIFQLDKTQT